MKLLFLPILLYHPIMEITMNGQSLGKKIMGIRVVNEIGGRPGISQFLIRWLLRVSDLWIAILLFIVISNPNFIENAESTFMVLAGLAFLITDIVLVVIDVADSYVPSYPQIMQLSDKDINAIKSILETSRKKNDYNMAESACYKIKSHLKIESTLPPFDLLDTLLKDYNYLSTK